MTGSNLTGACKLIFKVARNERNDNLFAAIDVPGDNLIDNLCQRSNHSIRAKPKLRGFVLRCVRITVYH